MTSEGALDRLSGRKSILLHFKRYISFRYCIAHSDILYTVQPNNGAVSRKLPGSPILIVPIQPASSAGRCCARNHFPSTTFQLYLQHHTAKPRSRRDLHSPAPACLLFRFCACTMPAPNSVSILASGARSFFRCDAEGNARVSAFMGERDLDYKWFWASFVSWCVRVADRSLDTVSTAPEEEVILSCLRATPTNARGLVEGLRWYETHRYIHGGVTNGLIKLGQHGKTGSSFLS